MPTNMKRFEFHRRDLLKVVTLGAADFFQAYRIGASHVEDDELAHDRWSSIPDLRPLERFY
jgi:hypothetical protein